MPRLRSFASDSRASNLVAIAYIWTGAMWTPSTNASPSAAGLTLENLGAVAAVAGTLLALLLALSGAFVGGYRFAVRRLLANGRAELSRQRYSRLYAPMRALFLTRHVTSGSASLAPYFRQRLTTAWRRARQRRFREAWRAVWDKRETEESAEIEFGGSFPLDAILALLHGNEQYADERLLNLIRRADRSRYDERSQDDTGSLTEDELALFHHIARESARLGKKFERYGPAMKPSSAGRK